MAMYALERAKKDAQKTFSLPLEPAQNPAWGDLGAPCFSLAQQRQQPPQQIAQELARKKLPPWFERAHGQGPYVNVFFSEKFFRAVLNESAKPNYGKHEAPTPHPVVLEYSQPNPGKPMHLGHIRSTIIGDVCANALDLIGTPVVRLNYLNDRGAHIAELITALETFKKLPQVTDEKSLLAYYVKIKAEIEKDVALKEKTRHVLEHLHDHEKQLAKIRELSWTAFQRNYDALGIRFDAIPLETTLESDSRARVQECLDKGLAKKEPDGTIITKLDPELSNTVLLRSNGTPLYFTSDLALADWKWKQYAFSQSWIFTASEQNLHFKQLQLLLTKMNRPYAAQYHHKGFGLIKLADGKMSTRQGRVVLLEDVIHGMIEEAKDQIEQRKGEAAGWHEKNIENQIKRAAKDEELDVNSVAKAVGIGALKYGVLKIRLEKDIAFDPAAEVQFEGDTSAYIQYAHVRACAIMEKNKQANAKLQKLPQQLILNASEKELLKKIAEFPEVLQTVTTTMQPHSLCEYALALAKAFTSFYSQSPVMTAENKDLKSQRLHIVACTKNVLSLALGVMGIEALEKM